MRSSMLRKALTGLAGSGLAAVAICSGSVAPVTATVAPIPAVTGHVMANDRSAQPPSGSYCLANYDIACYTPQQIRSHYNLPALYGQGWDGTGRTIVIVDAFGSPTIAHDLQ